MAKTVFPESNKWLFIILNNIYDIEHKIKDTPLKQNISRNISRIKDVLRENNLFTEDPLGELFNETRSDLDATIVGSSQEDLKVIEVIKPIIRLGDTDYSVVVQKGIVIVESSKECKNNG